MEQKQWYKIAFYAKMDQDDIRTMSKLFCEMLAENMAIESEFGSIEPDEDLLSNKE